MNSKLRLFMELIKYFKKPGLEWQYLTQRNFLVYPYKI